MQPPSICRPSRVTAIPACTAARSGRRPCSTISRASTLFRRLLLVALLLEAGLLLILIPWSAFWERNYFSESIPLLDAILANFYVRGAVSGLGLVNILAALAELVDLFMTRRSDETAIADDPARLGDHHVP